MLIVVVLVFVLNTIAARDTTATLLLLSFSTIPRSRISTDRQLVFVFCQSPAFITQALPTLLPDTALPVCPYSPRPVVRPARPGCCRRDLRPDLQNILRLIVRLS